MMRKAPLTDHGRATGADIMVSVSITTFNHAPYIRAAVESVLEQQTDFPVELIVGDDCSTDGTREILAGFAQRHGDRVRLVLPRQNLGGGGVPMFAATMQDVRGRYVAMLDGDDYWTSPHKLALQVAHLEAHPECSMCFHDVLVIQEDGSAPPRRHNPQAPTLPITAATLLARCNVASCSPMFRRESILPLPTWFSDLRVGDLPLYVFAAEHGRVDFVDEVMGVWRLHPRGEWGGLDPAGQQLLIAEMHERFDVASGGRYRELLRPLIREAWYEAALAQSALGRRRDAWISAARVARLPFQRKPSLQYLFKQLVWGHADATLEHAKRALGMQDRPLKNSPPP